MKSDRDAAFAAGFPTTRSAALLLSGILLAAGLLLGAGATRISAAAAAAPPEPAFADPGPAPAAPPVIHPSLRRDLSGAPPEKERTVWVFFTDKGFSAGQIPDAVARWSDGMSGGVLARRARVHGRGEADLRDLPVHEPYVEAVTDLGGRLRRRTRWLNGASFEVTVGDLRRISELPFIREIVPVARGRNAERPAAARTAGGLAYGPSLNQLEQLNVPAVHAAGYTGSGVLVMMLDTGFFKDHDAFAQSEIVDEYDFVHEDGNVQNEGEDTEFEHYHGTSTWSCLGGYDPGRLIGPAYRSSFVLAKTEDINSETQAEEDNYVAALEWADTLGVWMTSASLTYIEFDDGSGYDPEDLDGDTAVITRAVDIAAQKGILCVNSMGNAGDDPGSLATPADADTVLAAGAVDSLGMIASWSSRGPTFDGRTKPELVARGVEVWAAHAIETDFYGPGSGTSFSGPLLGGCCALVLEAHPEWGPYEVIEALKASADRSLAPDNDYGWGVPDVHAAIFSSAPIYPSPFSLLSPPDGSEPNPPVTLAWEASEDLDSGEDPLYKVVLWDVAFPEEPLVYEGVEGTTFVVPDLLHPGGTYRWRVFAVDGDGHERPSREEWGFTMPVAVGVAEGSAVDRRDGLLVWPNPSRGGARFALTGAGGPASRLRLRVFDAGGRVVAARTVDRSGWEWDGRDPRGRPVPSGVYWMEVSPAGGAVVAGGRWVKLR